MADRPKDETPESEGAGDARAHGESGALLDRIEAARRRSEPKPAGDLAKKYNAMSMAWRMTIELVAGVGLGFAVGYGLDALLGTAPWLMLVFLLFGFAAGVKTVMTTASGGRARDEGGGGDGG